MASTDKFRSWKASYCIRSSWDEIIRISEGRMSRDVGHLQYHICEANFRTQCSYSGHTRVPG